MKTSSLLAGGLFAFAVAASGSASAKIINESYYPPGEDFAQSASLVSRADVKSATRAANLKIDARLPRREFGAGSHDNSPEVFSRPDVKAQAKSYTRTGAHQPFTY